MSVTIRLTKMGRKNLPSYRLVVANTKDKRNGRVLEVLGFYNPSAHPAQFDYDKEKLALWQKNGAILSDAVSQLVAGKYEFKPYKKVKAGAEPEQA